MLICSLRRLKSPRCLAVNEEKRSALAAACNQMVIGLRSGELELRALCFVWRWGLSCVCEYACVCVCECVCACVRACVRVCVHAYESGRAGQQGGVCPHWGCLLAQCALEWLHKYVCLQLHGALASSPCQYFLHTSFYPFCFSSRCCGIEEPANLAPVPTHSTRLFIILALLVRVLPTLVSVLMK